MLSSRRRAFSALTVLALAVGSVAIATPANAVLGAWDPNPIVAPAAGAQFTTDSVTVDWEPNDVASVYRISWTLEGAGTNYYQLPDTHYSLTGLADGNYSYYVGYESGGNWYDSLERSFVVDSHDPVIDFTSPIATVVQPGTSVSLEGTITDANFTSATLTLDHSIDLGAINSTTILRDIETAGLTQGTHTLTVDAFDSFGHSGSNSIDFEVDGVGPVAIFNDLTNNQFLNPAVDVAVNATLDEAASWILSFDGAPVSSGTGTVVYGMLNADPTWANGVARTVSIDATDGLGNNSISSVSVIADSKKPKLDIDSHVDGSIVGQFPFFEGTTWDESGISDVWLEFRKYRLDGTCGAVQATHYPNFADGEWWGSPDTSALADGNYCVRVHAVDGVGNESIRTIKPITVDLTAPAAFTLNDPSGWVVNSGDFTWTAATDDHDVTYTIIVQDLCGCSEKNVSGIEGTSYWHSFPTGDYTWWVIATDAAGNETYSTTSNYVFVVGTPTIKLPDAGDQFSDHLLVKWKPVNAPGGVRKYVVEFSHEEETFTKDVDSGAIELDQTFGNGRPDGEWTVRVKAVYWNFESDLGTRQGEWSDPITVVRDSVAPGVPVHLAPAAGAIQASGDVTFDWTDVAEADHYLIRTSLTNTVNDNGRLVDGQNVTVFDSNLPVTGAPEGTYYWQVRAVDAVGNVSDWSTFRAVTIDYEYVAPVPPKTTKFFSLSTQAATDEVTAEVTEEVEESDEPEETDEPSTTGEEAESGAAEETDAPADSGFPTGWIIVGIVIVILVGGGLLIRFLVRRAG